MQCCINRLLMDVLSARTFIIHPTTDPLSNSKVLCKLFCASPLNKAKLKLSETPKKWDARMVWGWGWGYRTQDIVTASICQSFLSLNTAYFDLGRPFVLSSVRRPPSVPKNQVNQSPTKLGGPTGQDEVAAHGSW